MEGIMNAIERIISAIPPEAAFSDLDRDEARRLLMACVLWALPREGPGSTSIEEMRNLSNGYGCWLGWLRKAIDAAVLEPDERHFFIGAFGMATALQLSFFLAKQSRPRGRRKNQLIAGDSHAPRDNRSARRPHRLS